MESHVEGKTNITVQAVIVRACGICGGKREQDKNCAQCGNAAPAVVHDLGTQAAFFSDPLKRLSWEMFGKREAARRARLANKEIADGDGSQSYHQGP